MIALTTRERTAKITPEGGLVTFQLDAWSAAIEALIPNAHPEVLHPGGFCKVVFAKGKQHVAIYQPLAPIAGQTDMGAVIVADESGQVRYQAVERGADYQFSTHHIPAFIYMSANEGRQVKPGKVSVFTDASGATYSIDKPCNRIWLATRSVGWGSVDSALWAAEDGTWIVQDYHQQRVIQATTHSHINTAIYALREGGAPDPNKIPPVPFPMREIQEKYNLSWMRKRYRIYSKFGPPLVHVEGAKNVFTYDNGVIVGDNFVRHPDGTTERPERLFVFDRAKGIWVDSPVRIAEIERQTAKQAGRAAAPEQPQPQPTN